MSQNLTVRKIITKRHFLQGAINRFQWKPTLSTSLLVKLLYRFVFHLRLQWFVKKSHYNSRVSLHEAPTKNDTLRWRTQGIFIAKGLKTFTIMKADWKTELFKLVTTDCQEELLSGCFRCHGSNQKIDLISKWSNLHHVQHPRNDGKKIETWRWQWKQSTYW